MKIPYELIFWKYFGGLLLEDVRLVGRVGFNLHVLTIMPVSRDYDVCLDFHLDQVVILLFTALGKHQTTLTKKWKSFFTWVHVYLSLLLAFGSNKINSHFNTVICVCLWEQLH